MGVQQRYKFIFVLLYTMPAYQRNNQRNNHRNNYRRRHGRHRDNVGDGLAEIYCAFVGAYECSETMVNTLFCSYLFQIILLSCMVSFGNMWASSKMGKNTAIVAEALSNSPTSFTFGPYGYCVIGNSSTIPTRCFNPNKAEEYTKKHTAIQKICFDKSESYLKTCSEWCSQNCYSAKFLKEIKKTDKKKRAFCAWDNTHEIYINEHGYKWEDGYKCCNAFTPRKYMPTSGCDISNYRAIECKVAGVLSPPLKEETASDKFLTDSIVDGQPEICQPSLHDYTIEVDDICSVELEKLMPTLMPTLDKKEQQKLMERACIYKAKSTTNKLFTLDQVDPQYIQPIMKMQNMGNAAIIYVILGTIFSFISMYFNPFGHENIPMRKKIIGVIYGNEAKETFATGICYCTFLQCGCCISNYRRINFSLAKVPKNMLRSWMCLCILLLLLQALSILNIVELLQFWNNEGMLHMVGFASKYISVYDYQSGYGKTFSGKLQIQKGDQDFAKENETGLGEDSGISSPMALQRPLLGKNNPAFAQSMARTQDPQMQQQMQMAQNMMQDPRMQQQMMQMAQLMAQNTMQDPRMQQQMQMAQAMALTQDPRMQQQMQMAQNTMQGVSKSTDDNNSFDKERPLSYGPDQPSLNGKNNEK
eukprot:g14852.t1